MKKFLSNPLLYFVFIASFIISAAFNFKFFYGFSGDDFWSKAIFGSLGLLADASKIASTIYMVKCFKEEKYGTSFGFLSLWLFGLSLSMFAATNNIEVKAGDLSKNGAVLESIKKTISGYEAKISEIKIDLDKYKSMGKLSDSQEKHQKQLKADSSYYTTLLGTERSKEQRELSNPTSTTTKTVAMEYSRYFGVGVAIFIELISLVTGAYIGGIQNQSNKEKPHHKDEEILLLMKEISDIKSAISNSTTVDKKLSEKSDTNSVISNTTKSQQTQIQRTTQRKSSGKKKRLSTDELVEVLIANNDTDLSYSAIEKKYSVSAPKVSAAKKIISGKSEEINQESPANVVQINSFK